MNGTGMGFDQLDAKAVEAQYIRCFPWTPLLR